MRIEKDQPRDAFGSPGIDRCNDTAAIAVSDKRDIDEIKGLQHREHVLHVMRKCHVRAGFVAAYSVAGQRNGMHRASRSFQQRQQR